MRSGKTLKGQIVNEYLAKFPNTPHSTLAKKIYKENVETFKNEDSVRSIIRYYTGNHGERHRKYAKEHKTEKAERANNLGVPNPFYLPEEDNEPFEPFVLPGGKTYAILSDVHFPYQDNQALTTSLTFMSKMDKLNGIVLNGDILDFYQLSRYEKDPKARRFSQELEIGRQFLAMLNKEFDVPIYYKIGNHEERYEAYLRIKAPELLDIEDFRLDVLLRFGEHNCHLITDKRPIKAGKLNIMHGHEFGRSVFSPVNPARGYYMRAKANVICGHNHQTSEHTEPDMNGKVTTTWSMGALCNLRPAYMPYNKWNHGFAEVEIDKDGGFYLNNYRIVNGKIL
jgi:predicted phosphodiesterase